MSILNCQNVFIVIRRLHEIENLPLHIDLIKKVLSLTDRKNPHENITTSHNINSLFARRML